MSDDMRWIDLGHGVDICFTSWHEHERVGLIERHGCPEMGNEAGNGVLFRLDGVPEAFPGRALWTVEQWEPLTLWPSLLCRACGHHGFIRDGRWVPA